MIIALIMIQMKLFYYRIKNTVYRNLRKQHTNADFITN